MMQDQDKDGAGAKAIFDPDEPPIPHPKIDPGDPGYDPDDPKNWGEKDKPPFPKTPPTPKPKPGPQIDPFPGKDD